MGNKKTARVTLPGALAKPHHARPHGRPGPFYAVPTTLPIQPKDRCAAERRSNVISLNARTPPYCVIAQVLSNDAQITLRERLPLRAWLRPRSATEPLQ
jgi:hypothetical protein